MHRFPNLQFLLNQQHGSSHIRVNLRLVYSLRRQTLLHCLQHPVDQSDRLSPRTGIRDWPDGQKLSSRRFSYVYKPDTLFQNLLKWCRQVQLHPVVNMGQHILHTLDRLHGILLPEPIMLLLPTLAWSLLLGPLRMAVVRLQCTGSATLQVPADTFIMDRRQRMDIDSKSEGNEIYIGLRSILSICLTAMFSCKADTQCVSNNTWSLVYKS